MAKQIPKWPRFFKQLSFHSVRILACFISQCWAWALEKLLRLAQIWQRIETPHSLCCDFRGYKSCTTRWSGGRVQVWVQVWALACHLAISAKDVLEGNRRLRGQNQRPSSWGRSPALLALVGRASTNTGRFRVSGSRCRQRLARLKKTCYQSCDTDSVQESTRF